MELSAVTWFELHKHTSVVNSLLLLFDNVYVPNTLWLETGSKFEDVFLKLSPSKNEIYDVVLTPVFLGGDPERNAVPFHHIYGTLPFERKEVQGIFIPFFEVLSGIDRYPPIFRDIVSSIFDSVNTVSPFQDYNRFTYDYAPLVGKGLSFIGKKETRGDDSASWFENLHNYIDRCFDVQRNMPVVLDAQTVVDIEKYRTHSNVQLRYNPEILISALLLSLAKVHLKNFVTTDPRIIVHLRETALAEKTAFVNKILEHTVMLHQLLDKDATFKDLLDESEFLVKTDVLPAYENARIRYEQEIGKSIVKQFITFTDKVINLGFSAFTLNYSEAKQSLNDIHKICTGTELHERLLRSGESYSNYCYLLRVEQE